MLVCRQCSVTEEIMTTMAYNALNLQTDQNNFCCSTRDTNVLNICEGFSERLPKLD